jgi:DNA invertase Pin-like site-specific DNA recombinase
MASPQYPSSNLRAPSRSLPAAIYARVSTDDQVGGRFDSCDSQAAVCRDVLKARGCHEVACLTDAAYSGGTMDRPGIRDLKRLIEDGEVKVVVVFKLERLSRNIDEFGPFRAFLHQHGCELVSATEDISEAEPEGRLKNNIIMAVSDFERRNVAKKVRIKLREQAKRGIWNGGMVPFGYDYDLNTQQLTPNPSESLLIKRIFEQAAELIPLTDIANALNAAGHRTKARIFARRDGTQAQVGSNYFRGDGLRLILTNPVYRGVIRFGGEEYPGRHEPLVTPDLWERANAATTKLPPRERPTVILSRDRHGHVLKGVVFCAHCRRALIPHDSGKKDPSGRPYRYYDCGQVTRKTRDQTCPVGRIAAGSLEAVVFGYLAQLSRHPDIVRAALGHARSTQKSSQEHLRAALDQTEKNLADVNRQVENCVEAIAAGGAEILGDELKQRVHSLRERRQEFIVQCEQLRQDLKASDSELASEKWTLAAIHRLGELLPKLDTQDQKELIRLLVERIDIRADRRHSESHPDRSLQIDLKLHLPELLKAMEEKIVTTEASRRAVVPRQHSLSLTLNARLGGQGTYGTSTIVTPFEHRVDSQRRTAPANHAARHPIHRALAWRDELQKNPLLEKQQIALREKIAPASLSHHLKLLHLEPSIQNFLRELTDERTMRFFSLRRSRQLAKLTPLQQLAKFRVFKQRLAHGTH